MATIFHPDCTLASTDCRIVKSSYAVPPATPWVAVYDGNDQLVGNPDPTVQVVGYTCHTCSRAWEQRTASDGATTLVNLPPATEPPVLIDIPYAAQEGDALTCTMGNWSGEPVSYDYQWVSGGTTRVGAGATYAVAPADVGQSLTCVVTATNRHGSTTAPPSNVVVVAPA
jgi:hypothetical protein